MENLKVNIERKNKYVVITTNNVELVKAYSKLLKFAKFNKKNKFWKIPISTPSIKYLYKFISAINKIKNIDVDVDYSILESAVYMNKKIEMSSATQPNNENLEIPIPEGLNLFEFQKAGVEYIEENNGNTLIGDEMGVGKMSDVNSNILTPYGWRTFGIIEVGDYVIGSDGHKCKVTGVFPQGEQDAYKVVFSDSTSHNCGLEHLWGVYNKDGYTVMSTDDIITAKPVTNPSHPKFFMPIVKPVLFRNRVSQKDEYDYGYELGHHSMMKESFVKPSLLFGALKNRLQVIQGLLDSNSIIKHTKTYDVEFAHKSAPLVDNVIELVRSLGGIAISLPIKGNQIDHVYRCGLILPPNIKMFRNLDKTKQYNSIKHHEPIKYIKRIDYLGKRRMQCISVDSKDSLYVIDDYNITHNTIQSCAWVNVEKKTKLPVLVICPKSAKYNWNKEIQKWVVGKKKVVIIESKNKHKITDDADFYIINYELVSKIEEFLQALNIQTVILDEIHNIKNSTTIKTKSTIKIAKDIKYKLGLTGTPILNRPIEAFTVLKLIDPIVYYNKHEYGVNYCGAKKGFGGRWEYKGYSNSRELQELLRSTVMIRRSKAQVLPELPDKIRSFVPINAKLSKEYELLTNETKQYAKDYLKLSKEKKENNEEQKIIKEKIKQTKNIIFTKMQELRQETFNLKKNYIIETIRDAVLENDEPVVVFIYHRESFEHIRSELKSLGIRCSGFTGEHDSETRFNEVEKFQQGEADVFITTLGAGSEIITLTRASHVIMGEMGWVPAKHIQAEDRCFRIGQKNCVNVYYILLEDSIDMYMAKVVEEKFRNISAMLDLGVKDENDVEMFNKLILNFSE